MAFFWELVFNDYKRKVLLFIQDFQNLIFYIFSITLISTNAGIVPKSIYKWIKNI